MAHDPLTHHAGDALRDRISDGFYRWGRWVADRAGAVLAACLVLVFSLGTLLPGLRADFSLEGYLHPEDPTRVLYDQYRHQFDRGDSILVGVSTSSVWTSL